ncbi:MAG TPA: hypothetical protein VEJ86_14290, partial [Candidatus Binataceae bacterium]|nr:hypothetical protein [Candidatus Binataceae bacterium]
MRHQPPLAPSPDHDGARRFSAPDLPEWFQQLAELARAAASAALCTLAWKSYSSGGNASAPAASGKSQDLASAALELLGTGNAAAQTRPARREHFLSRPELARVGEQMGVRAELVWACDFVRDDAELKVVLVADRGRASSEIKAILSMTGQAGLAALTEFELNQSRSFWRDRASEVSSDLARTKATREAADQRQSELESAFATLERATGRDREPTIDRVLVRLGMRRDFDGSEGPLGHEFATRLGTLRRAWT